MNFIHKSLLFFISTLAISYAQNPTTPPVNQAESFEDHILIQADQTKISIQEAIEIFKKQAILIYFHHKKLPKIDPFQNTEFIRKQLSTIVEAKLIKEHAQKDQVQLSAEEQQKALSQIPQELAQDPILGNPMYLDILKQEIIQQELVKKWVKSKISQIPDQDIEKEYLRQNTAIRILQAQIARIPSYPEIQEAKQKYSQEITAFYQSQIHRFTQEDHYLVNVVQIDQQQLDELIPAQLLIPNPSIEEIKQDRIKRAEILEQKLLIELKNKGSLKALCQDQAKLKCTFEQLIKSSNIKSDFPANFNAQQFEQTPVTFLTHLKFHHKDWRFYEVIKLHKGYQRSLDDDRIQTEIASEILQQKNELPSTYAFATQVKDFMEKLPLSMAMIWDDQNQIDALPENERKWVEDKKAWLKQKQARLILTESFKQSPSHYTPKLGKSDPLHDLLFQMQVGQTSQIYPIRQVLVIAKIIEYQTPLYPWTQMRESFSEKWRTEKQKSFIEQYLNDFLKDKKKAIHPKYASLLPIPQISTYLDQLNQLITPNQIKK